jgi:hypothetical protein
MMVNLLYILYTCIRLLWNFRKRRIYDVYVGLNWQLFSAALNQTGPDDEGILGFFPEEIFKEVIHGIGQDFINYWIESFIQQM